MQRRDQASAIDRVREKHGMAEVSVEVAARVLKISTHDVLSLVASGELKSRRIDPLGSPIVDYGSLIDFIARVARQNSEVRTGSES